MKCQLQIQLIRLCKRILEVLQSWLASHFSSIRVSLSGFAACIMSVPLFRSSLPIPDSPIMHNTIQYNCAEYCPLSKVQKYTHDHIMTEHKWRWVIVREGLTQGPWTINAWVEAWTVLSALQSKRSIHSATVLRMFITIKQTLRA